MANRAEPWVLIGTKGCVGDSGTEGIAGSNGPVEGPGFPGRVGICGSWALMFPDPMSNPNPAISVRARITHPRFDGSSGCIGYAGHILESGLSYSQVGANVSG
jgi:hypothetical protein